MRSSGDVTAPVVTARGPRRWSPGTPRRTAGSASTSARVPRGEHRARGEAHQPVHDLDQRVHDVLDPDHRGAAVADLADDADELGQLGVGQSAGDLVEQQQPRPGRPARAPARAACGRAGAGRRRGVGPVAAARSGSRLRERVGLGRAAAQPGPVHGRPPARSRRRSCPPKGRGHLVGAPDPGPAARCARRRPGDVVPVELDPCRRRRASTPSSRSSSVVLPGPVRPDDAEGLAARRRRRTRHRPRQSAEGPGRSRTERTPAAVVPARSSRPQRFAPAGGRDVRGLRVVDDHEVERVLLAVACRHCPPTSGVLATLGTGPLVQSSGPTTVSSFICESGAWPGPACRRSAWTA